MKTSFFDAATSPLTYGITPPKLSHLEPKRREIAAVQTRRMAALPIDALVIYDLQDESSRTEATRPFPFLQCIDPADYAFAYLHSLNIPKIVYRSVSQQNSDMLKSWLGRVHQLSGATVLVGAPSHHQSGSMSLREAYDLRQTYAPSLPLGGVVIAERHVKRNDEHLRALAKIDRGCEFLISQAVYSVTASKNLLSDMYYRCQAEDRTMPTILVTLSPCGSPKTLEFLNWLGISVPQWLRNELLHAHDILEASVNLCVANFRELYEFAQEKEFNIGCNVESVSLRKSEIEASVEMVHRIAEIMRR